MGTFMTVREALESMRGTVDENGKVKLNRFNKKKFSDLLTALANDTEFTTEVARSVNGGSESVVEEIAVSKDFRKWCRKLVEQAGVDKMDSARVLDPKEFVITDMGPFYDFFTTAMIEYMDAGNYFSLPTKPDFEATMAIRKVDKKTVTKEAYTPGAADKRAYLGVFETTYDKHRELAVSSSCPKFLKKRKKVKD